MLQPKKRKFAKDMRGRRRGLSLRGSGIDFGDFGLKSQTAAWVTANQIEAARKAITHFLKKGGKMWIRIFPDKPISGRAAGKRMGGGKGEVLKYAAVVKPGRVLFEIAGVSKEVATEAFVRASAKLPLKTVIVEK